MKILFIGDVVGKRSTIELSRYISGIKQKEQIDITIVNGENSADGNGITPSSAKHLLEFADIITTGNHAFRRREMDNMYNESEIVIRPLNMGDDLAGRGVCVLDYGRFSLAVVNLIGVTNMVSYDNPFKAIENLLPKIETRNILVDFHGETTSEKKAMGYFLRCKVSAVIGTHTHVQTADEQIIDGHTAYITDVGMTGPFESVLGVERDIIIKRYLNYQTEVFSYPDGQIQLNAVVIEIDEKSGKAQSIKRINEILG